MATAKIVLRKKLNNGEYRVAIRYAHLDETCQYINLPFRCLPEQWLKDEQRFKKTKIGFKSMNKALEEAEDRIELVLTELSRKGLFTFVAFHRAYLDESDTRTVRQVFEDKLSELKLAHRDGSYITYKCALDSLEKYQSLNGTFEMVNYSFLKGFEQYHLKLGNKLNTVGNYLRSLRALHYEFCKENNLPKPGIYERFNIARFKNETPKLSLTKEQLKRFIDHEPNSSPQLKAKNIFLFSFYCRGINLMDILQLTDKNVHDNMLVFTRSKTGKQMKTQLTQEALSIIQWFANDTVYLFPYIRPNDNVKNRVRSINRYVNEQLQLICEDMELGAHITMYTARHTFAELNYKSGVRIEIISQMLGHCDLKTTQTYLRSFSDDEVDNAASKVFDSLQ